MFALPAGDANSIGTGATELGSVPGIRMIRTKRIPKVRGRGPKGRAGLTFPAPRLEDAPERQIGPSKIPGRRLAFVAIAQNAYRARRIPFCDLRAAQLKSNAGPANQKLRQPVSAAESGGIFRDRHCLVRVLPGASKVSRCFGVERPLQRQTGEDVMAGR